MLWKSLFLKGVAEIAKSTQAYIVSALDTLVQTFYKAELSISTHGGFTIGSFFQKSKEQKKV